MIWRARPKPLIAVTLALILATAGVAVQGRQEPDPEKAVEQTKTTPPPKAGSGTAIAAPDVVADRALARKQLALIDEALEMLHQLGRNSRISLADPAFSLWGRRKIETLRKVGAGKAEIVAALEEYINRLKQDEALVEALRQSARATKVDTYDVQFRRMEAESWLNEEKAK
jgi:hypothetical protein